MKNIFIILVALSSIIGKSQTKKVIFNNNSNQLKRVWMLIEFQKFKKEELIKNQAQLNLSNFNSVSANLGCNQIGLKINFIKNKIRFNNVIATEMYCEKKMDLENAFSKSISANFNYKINGHTLTLINSKREKMVFIAQDWD